MAKAKVARLGDKTTGTCYHPSHPAPVKVEGTIITASSIEKAEGQGIARLGDLVLTSCGHYGKIVTASEANVKSTDRNGSNLVARVGDKVDGMAPYKAIIITGASKVSSG